jgi:cathepsin X
MLMTVNFSRQGEMGYMRIEMGKNLLGIEGEIAWATPGSFTVINFPCYENGENCVQQQEFVDPSSNLVEIKRRLTAHKAQERRNIRG